MDTCGLKEEMWGGKMTCGMCQRSWSPFSGELYFVLSHQTVSAGAEPISAADWAVTLPSLTQDALSCNVFPFCFFLSPIWTKDTWFVWTPVCDATMGGKLNIFLQSSWLFSHTTYTFSCFFFMVRFIIDTREIIAENCTWVRMTMLNLWKYGGTTGPANIALIFLLFIC